MAGLAQFENITTVDAALVWLLAQDDCSDSEESGGDTISTRFTIQISCGRISEIVPRIDAGEFVYGGLLDFVQSCMENNKHRKRSIGGELKSLTKKRGVSKGA